MRADQDAEAGGYSVYAEVVLVSRCGHAQISTLGAEALQRVTRDMGQRVGRVELEGLPQIGDGFCPLSENLCATEAIGKLIEATCATAPAKTVRRLNTNRPGVMLELARFQARGIRIYLRGFLLRRLAH
jgi:hypothetical protein